MAIINWTDITDLNQLPEAANTASNGTFWSSMFYMMWLIMIISFMGWGFEVALIVSSFLMIIIGLIAVYAELFAWQNLLTVLGTLLFMFLYVIWSSRKVRN